MNRAMLIGKVQAWAWILGGILIGTSAYRRYREGRSLTGLSPTAEFIAIALIAMWFFFQGIRADQRSRMP